jgi:hypothetical protein
MAAGCAGECEAYNLYEKNTGQKVLQRQVRGTFTHSGIKITGVADGIVECDGERCILEIKNRMKSYKGVNPWDRCQVQFYMHIHGLNRAFLVERLVNDIRIHTQVYHANFITACLVKLEEFSKRYAKFIEKYIERYRHCKNKDRYLKKHLFVDCKDSINHHV